jgi:hypothetical protein
MTQAQRKAAGVKMPTDHEAPASAEQETVFEYDGETYRIAPSEMWPLEVAELAEDGKETSALRMLLGDAQWATFKAKPRFVKDLRDMFDAAGKAVGAGN